MADTEPTPRTDEVNAEIQVVDQRHLDAWADTHEGYTVQTRVSVVRCLWCDYISIAPTKHEAIARFQHQHNQPILDRESKRVAEWNARDKAVP